MSNTDEPSLLYFEDVEVGAELTSRWYPLERDEIVAFAREWDPQPFHLDEAAAQASVFGGLAACTPHLFAILSRLSFELPRRFALVSGLGGDGLELIAPVLVGTRIRLRRRFSATRASRSRPEAGVVTFSDVLEDEAGSPRFRTAGSVLLARRAAG